MQSVHSNHPCANTNADADVLQSEFKFQVQMLRQKLRLLIGCTILSLTLVSLLSSAKVLSGKFAATKAVVRRGPYEWEHFAARHGCRLEREPSITESLMLYDNCTNQMDASFKDVHQMIERNLNDMRLVGFSIQDQTVSTLGPYVAVEPGRSRAPQTVDNLQTLANEVKLPDVQFAMFLGDKACIPRSCGTQILVQEKSTNPNQGCTGSIYTPPRSTLGFVTRHFDHNIYEDTSISSEHALRVARTSSSLCPFNAKIDKAVFRGSTTGGNPNVDNWRTIPRSLVVQVSLDYPHLLDARFTKVVQVDEMQREQVERDMQSAGFMGPSIEMDAQWRYKLIVVPDGNSVPDRLLLQLAGNSVVLKPHSLELEYWYGELVPWEHFIPYKADASDLAQVIEAALKNQTLLEHVASQSTQFVLSHLNPSRVMCYWGLLLREYDQHRLK